MKHTIITGANAGIGFATAKGLLEKGFKVSMFCRNIDKAEEAKKELIKLTGNKEIDIFQIDFSSLQSIKTACNDFKAKYNSLDVLLNNAGATFAKFELSEDGIEKTMAVNHFGYFAMAYYLLPLLKNTPNSRIVNVASKAHFGSKMNFETINAEKGYFIYNQYENSKLANVLFTKYLAEKLKDDNITVNCLHPGVVKTQIGNKAGNTFFGMAWSLFAAFGINTDKGAETSIYLASNKKVADISGMYFDKKKAYKGSELSRNKQLQQQLWEWSEKMSGLEWSF
ncbi:MAG: SDR family oxidoreductase [Chitinophagales bacterium]|nr:SDR family oxidoreductase [Chitinophagales bacterium]